MTPRSLADTTASVLCVLVCHDGEAWLGETLDALRAVSPRPRRVLAVDTGSTDGTADLLAGAKDIIDGVVTADAHTGYAAAVSAGVAEAEQRWGEIGDWVWLLHDDSAPETACLAVLLSVAGTAKSAAILGPLHLDWDDPRLIVEAGLSTDASGHRQSGVLAADPGWAYGDAGLQRNTEVLAVSSAGALIRTQLWTELGGFDSAYTLLREDVDLGWRCNHAGKLVLLVPAARMRHARATLRGKRPPSVGSLRTEDRAGGMRTFLVNTGRFSFLFGVPRLALLCVVRALALALCTRFTDAGAELRALGRICSGHYRLRAARAARAAAVDGSVRGLFTTRRMRLRSGVRGVLASVLRRSLAGDAALGKLSEDQLRTVWIPDETEQRRSVALPVGAVRHSAHRGLRLPTRAVVVPTEPETARPSPHRRPSPNRRGEPRPQGELILVELSRTQMLRKIVAAPLLLLFVGLVIAGVLMNRDRLGFELSGGRILPLGDLPATWNEYFASWHAVAGGTGASSPAALAVLGVIGAPFWLVGGPATALSLVLMLEAPLAGLAAYYATRRLRVARWIRAMVAAGYALLPPATAAVAQGRVDAIAVHLVLPMILFGIGNVLVPKARGAGWLSAAAICAIWLAVLGAFSPLMYLLLVVLALAGFVVVPAEHGQGARRVGSLFVLVLLPLALLLPWPAVLLQHPALVLQGVGARVADQPVSVAQLLTLDPGGAGGWPLIGVLVLLAGLVAILLRPRAVLLAGVVTVVFGAIGAAVVTVVRLPPIAGGAPAPGWAGAPLLLAGTGALVVLLHACVEVPLGQLKSRHRLPGLPKAPRITLISAAAMILAVLALSGITAGALGPLRSGGAEQLADAQRNELAMSGSSVLVLGTVDEPSRQRGHGMPAFGDDELPPVPGASERIAAWTAELRSGVPAELSSVIGQLAADGVTYIVADNQAEADGMRTAASGLIDQVQSTNHGRPVLRLRPSSASVVLVAPTLARQAVTGGQLPANPDPQSITPVFATIPPDVGAGVAEGSRGRLLVLAAEYEPGWQATIDGKTVPLTKAWGHQLSVSVPETGNQVHVYYSTSLRAILLLCQAAAVLLTLLSSIPLRKRE